jgi:aspartokinase/homoserine dehydrogenase 1
MGWLFLVRNHLKKYRQMKVLKFGGTSMGEAATILQVKKIVSNEPDQVHVVVSALGGTTDQLIGAARQAALGEAYEETVQQIIDRHLKEVKSLFPGNNTSLEKELRGLFSELSLLLKGVSLTGELSERSMDTITGFGERFSSRLFFHLFDNAVLHDSRKYIITQKRGNKHQVDFEMTTKQLNQLSSGGSSIHIWPGFIASDAQGVNTTLGRGGSDYTAAILAASLKADILEIWTDVDGFMSADPRVITRAYTIDHLTYAEAMELSHFGAKVIYPPTIIPVLQKQIPIRIKNTFKPDHAGTLIDNEGETDKKSRIKGISSIRNISLITLQGLGMIGISGISMRFFKALAQEHINVILISQASSENSITVAVNSIEAKKAGQAIEAEFALELSTGQVNPIMIESERAIVAIVGERMKHTSGVAGQLFKSLGTNGVNLYAIAQGASELNISFVIRDKDLRKALNVIHEAFFLINYQIINVYLAGMGTVGANLLKKLEAHSHQLQRDERVVLRLVGVTNSRNMVFHSQGLDYDSLAEVLSQGEPADIGQFTNAIIENNRANSVFVDCTASGLVAEQYEKLLKANVSVVTANKIASSSSYDVYKNLKIIARQNGVKYLFETNVGAGLPIIGPINSLINSGDKIIKLEAVLSGTLNYIVNEASADKSLSEVIVEAREKGYSEPDPRIDLSGMDVVRKILILARESGGQLEQDDIQKESFIPEEVMNATSVEQFLHDVVQQDDAFEERRAQLASQGKCLRYVASYENGVAKVGFKEVGKDHAMYNLEGSNNMVLIWSEYYKEHPLVIKGYGAGADVTAAGVFADIIRVANV